MISNGCIFMLWLGLLVLLFMYLYVICIYLRDVDLSDVDKNKIVCFKCVL